MFVFQVGEWSGYTSPNLVMQNNIDIYFSDFTTKVPVDFPVSATDKVIRIVTIIVRNSFIIHLSGTVNFAIIM